ncbi:MAG: glycine--tRNA ligase [Candidatus Aenigmarchaeota archaeon]|nr:glycine--tRNA ligase [Candidatus Aenigmarchaeota archaeon]
MPEKEKLLDKIEEIAKNRGFFWPSQEIYGGVSGFYEYGPLGALLKKHIQDMILDYYVMQEGCLAIEAPVLTSISPWIASGHVESFADRMTECEKCGEPYRADHIIEEKTGKGAEGKSMAEMDAILKENNIRCPKCKGVLGKVYDYNMMFRTFIGPGKNKIEGALRPETAQTTYMPFRRLYEIARRKMPFGVIQIGKSFRNEISPRKALIRQREFTQAEIQFFTPPALDEWKNFDEIAGMEAEALVKGSEKTVKMKFSDLVSKKHAKQPIAYFLARSLELFRKMGMDMKKLRLRQHRDDERSFYSSDTWDVEFLSDKYGVVELVGIADRTDYDLKRHQEQSKQSMEVTFDGKKFIPNVIEVAYGIDRPVICIMESVMKEEKERLFFSFPAAISPYQVAVFPLVRKDNLPVKARYIFDLLRKRYYTAYDETGSIGRMYYRQDEAGTPLCITVDYDTLEDGTVTIRERDTQKQIRVHEDVLIDSIQRIFDGEGIESVGNAA